MDLQLYCLYDPQCAPTQFKPNRSNKEPRFSCKLPDCGKVKQLMLFLQGDWPQELQDRHIAVQVVALNHTQQLCTLSESSRFFQVSGTQRMESILPSSGKPTLVATLKDEDSVTETDEKSEEKKKQDEKSAERKTQDKIVDKDCKIESSKTCNNSESSKPQNTKPKKKCRDIKNEKRVRESDSELMEKDDLVASSPTPVVTDSKTELSDDDCKKEKCETDTAMESKDKQLTMQEINEATPEMTFTVSSPFVPKNKKRQREDDATPKSKFRRQKMAMKALSDEKNTPTKEKLQESAPGSPLTTITNVPVSPSSNADGKITKCVDLSSRTPKPSQRWGHTMTFVNRNQIVLVGGQGEKQLSRDSIWNLDPEMRTWKSSEVVTEGSKPEYRVGHTATFDPTMRCIYIYGGSKNAKWFHDVHMFDLDQNKWSLVKTSGKAPTRAYHSATLWRYELWIFGGVFPRPDPQPDGCDNEIQIFSPVMESWYKPIVTGEKPRARSGHSATLLNDLMVVFGGWDFPYCYNDICILDLTTVDWSTPTVFGEPPKPRSWHASCALTHNRVFIHGGYDGDLALHDSHIFDLETKSWSQLCMSQAPSARAGHVAILLPSDYENQDEDEVIIFGGGDNDGCYFNDMLSFYIPFNPQTV